jgi:hypothetical protein
MRSAGEKAMALVDGQLAPAEVPALVQELARNATLLAELQDYLATSRSRLARAYAAKTDEPVPSRLVDAVLATPVATDVPQPAAAASSLGLVRRLADWLRDGRRVPTWSLAAAPTLAAAAAFAIAAAILPAGESAPPRGALASLDLGAALERAASGKDATLATLRPMLSFSSKNAGWCRQYELRGAGKQTSHGVACRAQGGWQVIATTPPSAAAGSYAPAGVARRKAIDDIVTSMIVGEPLSPEGEAAVIGRGWQL